MPSRSEDRRSCHNVSLMLGLAIASQHFIIADYFFGLMLHLVTPVIGQRVN